MPLPDAKPDPNKANIYEQFSNIKAKDFTRANLEVVLDPLYLNALSEDVLRRILLIGETTNSLSTSGPMPYTAFNISKTITTAGPFEVFKPNKGEVWLLQGAQLTDDDASFHNLFWTDDDADPIDAKYVSIAQETGSSFFTPINPPYITHEQYLSYGLAGTIGGGNNTVEFAFIRVR